MRKNITNKLLCLLLGVVMVLSSVSAVYADGGDDPVVTTGEENTTTKLKLADVGDSFDTISYE